MHNVANLRYDEKRTQDEIIKRTPFDDHNFIHSRMSSSKSLLTNATINDAAINTEETGRNPFFTGQRSYAMMLELIRQSLFNNQDPSTVDEHHYQPIQTQIPTFDSILDSVQKEKGIVLDDKQLLAYYSICATFLIGLISDGHDDSTILGQYFTALGDTFVLDRSSTYVIHYIKTKLKSFDGKDQLIMFLTGPAGAGKTTAVKMAEKFCFHFAELLVYYGKTILFCSLHILAQLHQLLEASLHQKRHS